MKHLRYRGELVAVNTELAQLILDKQDKKAEAHWKKLHAEFMENFNGFEHLINFKLGSIEKRGSV